MEDLYPSRKEREEIIPRVDKIVYNNSSLEKDSLDSSLCKQYEENGFLVIPDAFSQEETKEMLCELEYMASNNDLAKNEEFIYEPNGNKIRTVFNQHQFSTLFDKVSKDTRIINKVKQILGSDVYIHHSRINIKPAYNGKSFPWHSDFETWHAEDGLPNCRCLSAWIMLSDNTEFNGPLYVIPKSHKKFVSCKGETPENNYKKSLKKQEYGVPSIDAIKQLEDDSAIAGVYGKAGTLVIHDGNLMHGSPDNISSSSRTNAFFVFNSVENKPLKPFGAKSNRAEFLCLKDFTAITSN